MGSDAAAGQSSNGGYSRRSIRNPAGGLFLETNMAMATPNPCITASQVTMKDGRLIIGDFRRRQIDRENAEQIVARIDRNLELRRMLRQPPSPPSRLSNRQEMAIVLVVSALVGLGAGALILFGR